MEGEGEFVGPDAYSQFGQLANMFYNGGPGLLIHPLWQAANAYFVSLRLEQEPRPDFVRYSFTFWEDDSWYGRPGGPAEPGRSGRPDRPGVGAVRRLPPGGVGGHPVGAGGTVRPVPG